jgi:hypothetical protein
MAIAVDVADLGHAAGDPALGTIAFTTTSPVASGGFIVLSVGWFDGTATLSSVAGGGLTWTIDFQGKAGVTSDRVALVSAQAPAGLASGTTITATFSAATPVAREIGGTSFTGVATSSPVDVALGAAVAVSPSAAGWTSGSLSVAAGSVMIATCYNESGNFTNTVTAPSLQAVLMPNAASPTSQVTCYRIESSAGSVSVAGTWSTAATSGTGAVAYKAAAGGAVAASTPVVSPLLRMLVQRGRQQRALALSFLFPPTKTPALVDQSVSLTGFSNPAQFGAPTVIPDQSVSLTGLDNPAQFGTPSVSVAGGDQTINPSGLSNPALFGTIIRLDQEARLTGLLNAAQFGVVRLDDEARLTGLSNPALFGVVRLDQEARLSGFANVAQFGTPSPAQTVLLSGLFNPAQFGSVTIQGGGVVVSTARTRMTMGYGE